MKGRLAALLAIVLVAAVGAIVYVLHVHKEQIAAIKAAPKVATTTIANVTKGPYLVFRNTALGSGYGQVAAVPLSAPDGSRAIVPDSCDRVYARGKDSICLAAVRGLVTTYKVEILGPNWKPLQVTPLAGLPSRARMSPDGSLTATTTFVYGDSYTNPGQFSTRTIVSHTNGAQIADIEQFTLIVDGKVITAASKNFWGMTFADDDDTFYATAAFNGKTYLVKGSISAHRMVSIRSDVECPSLSPDGTRIAFKRHGNLAPGQWRLAVYNLVTGKETLLAETRSVDDQVEWLDDSRILYGLPRGGDSSADDVWVVPADGTGTPQVFVHNAFSPAVVQ